MAVIGIAEVLVRPSFKGTQREVGKGMQGIAADEGTRTGSTMGQKLGSALKGTAVLGAGAAVAGIGLALTKGFGRLQAIENARAKLVGLGHSAEGVETIMGNALTAVKGTAFGLGDAATVAANAVAAGVKPGKDLERTLKLTGDAATIAGVGMGEMGAIFNKAAASNKVQMDVINQLHDAGVPALALIADEMGVTAEAASAMASKGEVDFAIFQNAMEKGMGGAAQSSGKTLQGAFANTMAAVGRIGANLMSEIYPQITGFFSGMISWLEPLEERAKEVGATLGDFLGNKLIPALQSAAKWIKENKEMLSLLASAAAGVLAALLLLSVVKTVIVWVKAATVAFHLMNAAMRANPIGLIVTAIGLLVGALVWLYNNNETARKIMNAAWDGIKNAIKFAWERVIKPVFDGIVWVLKNVLAPTFQWLWDYIIKPIWGFISAYIKVAWGIIETVFLAIKWAINNVLAPIFRWLWNNVIKPVWDGISTTIRDVWNNNIKPIFEALGKFIEEKVKPAFKRGVKGIEDIWNGIRNIARKPINFVIDTVYNNGLRAALNKVRSIVGGDPLPKLDTIPAFAKGGQMGRGWKLVGEEGPELINTGPGYVYTAAQSKRMLNAGGMDDEQLRHAAGSNPSEAQLPMGGFMSDAWGAITSGIKKATDWVRGGLASAAGLLLDPIKSGLGALLPDTGLGDLAKRGASSAIDGVLKWIRGKDEVPQGAGALTFDGPLGATTRPGGKITSHFGPRWGTVHTGTDWAGVGSVRAFWNGIVRATGMNVAPGRTGIGAILDHANGLSSYYGHMVPGSLKVRPGQEVRSGQVIGSEGESGNVTGRHLHGEVWKNGRPQNPLAYLYDQGGVLSPGLSTILNNTGKPEAILSGKQWDDISTLAGTNAAPTRDVHVHGNLGYDPMEIIRLQRREDRRAMTLAGL